MIFIHSEDYNLGNSSNGIWQLGRNLKGSFKVVAQTMETQSYPWIWSGTNNLKINFPDDELNHSKVVSLDYSLGNTVNYTEIQTLWEGNIQEKLDEIKSDTTGAVDVTVAVTFSDNHFHFAFTGVPNVVQFLLGDVESTCAYAFNRNTTIANVNTISIANTNMTIDPKYLFVYIEEANSELTTTHGAYPSILFSTKDSEFLGQNLAIRSPTNILTMQIRRMHQDTPIPLSGQWYLIIEQTA